MSTSVPPSLCTIGFTRWAITNPERTYRGGFASTSLLLYRTAGAETARLQATTPREGVIVLARSLCKCRTWGGPRREAPRSGRPNTHVPRLLRAPAARPPRGLDSVDQGAVEVQYEGALRHHSVMLNAALVKQRPPEPSGCRKGSSAVGSGKCPRSCPFAVLRGEQPSSSSWGLWRPVAARPQRPTASGDLIRSSPSLPSPPRQRRHLHLRLRLPLRLPLHRRRHPCRRSTASMPRSQAATSRPKAPWSDRSR